MHISYEYLFLFLSLGPDQTYKQTMADYWKSQPRKFCEFCKCWIADNKPSREFHEKGKKHQENVQKKIDEVMKKGRKAAADKAQMSDTLVEMERAALEALKKDLQRDPSLAAQYGVKIKKKETDKSGQDDGTSSEKQSDPADTSKEISSDQSKPDPNQMWKEEWTSEGFVYYWNTETAVELEIVNHSTFCGVESVWEKPEGYIPTWERTVKEQQQNEEDVELEPFTSLSDEVDGEKEGTDEEDAKEEPAEEKPTTEVLEPVNIKDIPLPDSEQLSVDLNPKVNEDLLVPVPEIGPPTRTQATKRASTSAYGDWKTVERQPEADPVDLQLPIKKVPAPEQVKTITVSEPKIKFIQKKVDTLGAEFVAFKKRKMAASMRGNVRKTDSENVL
ncbi:hypothetical protein LSH36_594g00002 [Paralvinella palmiformis]|uniref:Matrin-type domain-containing protein n=1 Tax=Paralvinella palmiformis TaxID=53620 RepID=A0AAD9J559_9ANNE|nr:hypothetical protein LSH36_594g00002 [Paralvinella palmiformis]